MTCDDPLAVAGVACVVGVVLGALDPTADAGLCYGYAVWILNAACSP